EEGGCDRIRGLFPRFRSMVRIFPLFLALAAAPAAHAGPLAARDFELQSLLMQWRADPSAQRIAPRGDEEIVAGSEAKRFAVERLETFAWNAAADGAEPPRVLNVADNTLVAAGGCSRCADAIDVAE